MESDYRYYMRRAAAERSAAERAVTPQARERRITLARSYDLKAAQCCATPAAPLLASL